MRLTALPPELQWITPRSESNRRHDVSHIYGTFLFFKEQQANRDRGDRFWDSNPQHDLHHTAHPLPMVRSNPFLRHP